MGLKYLIFGSADARRVPAGSQSLGVFRQLVGLCRQLAEMAQQYKLTVIVEPLNCLETNSLTSVASGVLLVREVNSPAFKLLLDTFHFLRTDGDMAALALALPELRHVHVATGNRLAPGREDCDFRPIFRCLKQAGYEGGLSIEAGGDYNPEILAKALQTMKEQWEAC